ncbi:phosphotransferase enzyme family protein [Micromonospora zhanjiangensis]|uniref:Phosphotransferase enzyme family protein n=1 Tax=Micromonospora zhanjiangensis TaxID=1522057 RepID=A0ABV8KMB5_9ACTN
MSDVTASDRSFTSTVAREVLDKACDLVGLRADDASLIRFGSNAIFELRGTPVVVRVGRSPERMPVFERELCVARWLADHDVPTVRPYDGVEHPLDVNGHPVSFWHRVESADPPPGAADLARLLRGFHAAGDSPCELPTLDPLGDVPARLAAARGIADEDLDFLRGRAEELHRRYGELTFELPAGPLHGDAYVGNLLGRPGAAVLLDYESAAVGPREWDLTPVAVAHRRLGLPDRDNAAFTEAYGHDVTAWAGFPVLAGIREVTMTTWLMQNVGEGQHLADEFRLRVRSLRDGDDTATWHAF